MVNLDDMLPSHPRIFAMRERLGPDGPGLAMGLHYAASAYSSFYQLDGFLPAAWVQTHARALCKRPEPVVEALCLQHLWEAVEGGYMVLDFLNWNPPAARRKESRQQAAERVRRHRERTRNKTGDVTPQSDVTLRVTGGVTERVADDESNGPETRDLARARSLDPIPFPDLPTRQSNALRATLSTPGHNRKACRRLLWVLVEEDPRADSAEIWHRFKVRAQALGLVFEIYDELRSYVDIVRGRYAIRELVEAGVEGLALADGVEAVLRTRRVAQHPDVVMRWTEAELRRFRRLQRTA